jgi:ABC-type glycerol-3-phosphate transport system substrate-binding protein
MERRSTRGHGQKGRRRAMRKFRMLAIPVVIVMMAAGCAKKSEDTGDSGQAANKGTVNVLNALEPEENAVLQGIADAQINGKVDYEVTFEQSGDFEQQVQIRAEGGTLDVILLPQPGAVQAQAAGGKAVSLEDMGFDIGALEDSFGT